MSSQQSFPSRDTEADGLAGFERLATLPESTLLALKSKHLTDAQRGAVDAEVARRLIMRAPPRVEPAPPTRPTFLLLQDSTLIVNGNMTMTRRGDLVRDFRIGYLQRGGAALVEVKTQWRVSNEMDQTQLQLELVDDTAAIPPIGVGYDLMTFAVGERPQGWFQRWVPVPAKQFEEVLRRR